MNLGDLRAALRMMLTDVAPPYRWDDLTLNRYLNNAVREACIRARLLKDDADSQPGLCSLAVVTGVPIMRFDPSILVIRSGALPGITFPKLWAVTADSLDKLEPCWDSSVNNGAFSPRFMVMDLSQKSFRLYPTPTADGTLRLRVWRMPMISELMRDDTDTPVIQLPDPEELCHWAASEAFMQPDAELISTQLAALNLAQFEQRFGARPSLHEMARWADSPPRVRFAHMF